MSGAVLIADISGFTRVAARLSALDSSGSRLRGAEAVQELLNQLFEPVVAAIQSAGGDVVCFAGDAVVAFWPADVSSAAVAATNAVAAAEQIQERLAPNAHDVELKVRSAVVSGDYWFAGLQGSTQRFVLLGGKRFARLATLLERVGPGETAMCRRTSDLVATTSRSASASVEEAWLTQPLESRADSRAASGTEQGVDSYTAPRAPSSRSDAPAAEFPFRQYVAPAAHKWLAGDDLRWLAELRQVSAVFLSFRGDNVWDPEFTAMQRFAVSVTDSAARFGGMVNQLVIDDKGLVALVVFGVSGHVHEDDSRRAVVLAHDVCEAMGSLQANCHAGIATGLVFSGRRGSIDRYDLAVIGQPINLAARLMNLAFERDGAVAIDSNTHAQVHKLVECELLHDVTLKGIRSDAQAYFAARPGAGESIQGLAAASTRTGKRTTAEALGRSAELDQLLRSLDQSMDRGIGSTWLVRGVAGIGKSSFLQAFAAQAEDAGVRVLRGFADAVDSSTPFHAWRGVFTDVLALLGVDSRQASGEDDPVGIKLALARLVGPDLGRGLALLNPLLPVTLEDSIATSQLSPDARREATLDLLVSVFAGLARAHQVVVILEDCHWLDDLSRQVLQNVTARVSELVVVASARTEVSSEKLFGGVDAHSITLHELSRQDTAVILCNELMVAAVPEALAEFVFARSGGHPLFVQQLASVLRRHPAVTITDSRCLLDRHVQLDELELPQSISALVTSTFDRIPVEGQIALKVLAVVGQPLTRQEMQSLLPETLGGANPLQSVEAPIAEQLLSKNDKGWDFRHALIRQSIYEVMTSQQRAQVHGDVADWMGSANTKVTDDMLGMLAFHNERAGRVAVAIELLETAGNNALYKDVAAGDAIKTLTRLLALEQQHPEANAVVTHRVRLPGSLRRRAVTTRRAHWQRLLGEAYAKMGESTRSVHHLGEALQELGLSLPPSRAFVAQQLCFGLLGRMLRLPSMPRPSTLQKQEYDAVVELVAAYDRFTRTCYTSGESLQGIASALRSTALAERLGPSTELCNAYCMMSNVLGATGRFAIARRYAAIANQMAENVGDPSMIAFSNSLPYLWQTTIWDPAALGPLNRAIATFDALGDFQSSGLFSCYVARLHTLGGSFDSAVSALDAMDRRVQKCGAVHLQIRSELSRAELFYRQRQFPQAVEWASRARATHEDFAVKDHAIAFQLSGLLALLALQQPGFHPGKPWLNAARAEEATRDNAVQHARGALAALRAGGAMSFFPHVGFMGIFEALLAQLQVNGPPVKALLADYSETLTTLRKQQRNRPYVRPFYYLYRGRLAHWRGKQASAVRQIRQGVAAAEALQGPWEIGLLRAALDAAETDDSTAKR